MISEDGPTSRGLTHSLSTLSIGQHVMPPDVQGTTLAHYSKFVDTCVQDFLCENEKASQIIEKVKQLTAPLFADVFVLRAIQHVIPMSEEKQADIAQLLTVAFDSCLFTRVQATRAFEKLLQQAVGFKQSNAEAVEAALFAFFTAAADDGIIPRSFLARLPEYYLKNLPKNISQCIPMISYNAEQLRRFKLDCTRVMETFFVEGSFDCLEEFFAEFKCDEIEEIEDSIVPKVTPELMRHEFIRRALTCGLSASPTQKELISKMLSELYEKFFSSDDIQLGVVRLLGCIDDLTLDCPSCSEIMSKFIVRMYVDDVLCPSFVNDFLRITLGDRLGSETLRRSFRWMTAGRTGLSDRFSRIWKSVEPHRPEVEQFRRDLKEIVFEFLNTGDLETAMMQLNMLEMTPDQEVQALRKAIIYTMERKREEWGMIVTLIESLAEADEIEADAVGRALVEIQERIADIRLDNPLVDKALEEFFVPQLAHLTKAA